MLARSVERSWRPLMPISPWRVIRAGAGRQCRARVRRIETARQIALRVRSYRGGRSRCRTCSRLTSWSRREISTRATALGGGARAARQWCHRARTLTRTRALIYIERSACRKYEHLVLARLLIAPGPGSLKRSICWSPLLAHARGNWAALT